MHTQKESIKGHLYAQMVDAFCHHTRLGHRIQTGELRKNMHEAVWNPPKDYVVGKVKLPRFSMELLEPVSVYCARMQREAKQNSKQTADATEKPAPSKKKQRLVILHIHGGGYVGKMTNMYRRFALLYSKLGQGATVLSPDYRVAPQHPYPAALQDVVDAFDWLLAKGWKEEEIVVAGESAGGGLTLALCHYLKRHKRALPAGLILMSPWTDLTLSGASYETKFDVDAVFGKTTKSMVFDREYLDGQNPRHPYISPLYGDYKKFPPMLLQVGGNEMLFSDAAGVAEKVKKAGGQIRFTSYEGMFHLFQLALLTMPESKAAWREVQRFLDVIIRTDYSAAASSASASSDSVSSASASSAKASSSSSMMVPSSSVSEEVSSAS